MNEYQKGIKVVGRNGEEGKLTGSTRYCSLSGCCGLRLYVRWNDGKLTIPCTKGMMWDENSQSWRIM